MFSFGRSLATRRSRIWVLRELFRVQPDKNEIEARALRLLKDWLSPKQLAQFNDCGYFDVFGCDTGKKYRIHYSSSMNIDELDDYGRPAACHCLVTDLAVALGDVVLAQKIALETGELVALSAANKFAPRRRI
jgi:hypothetical protein